MANRTIAIFVEGQGELIFIRNILPHLIENMTYSLECKVLVGNTVNNVPYCINLPSADIHFRIINSQGDSRVLAAIKEREEPFFYEGFDKIIGLRDMYSQKYRQRSGSTIDLQLNESYIDAANNTINEMSQPDNISIHFSIMELESWWLSMYQLFEKIDNRLTISRILDELGFDLQLINAENDFFHPAPVLTRVLNIANIEYSKRFNHVESITSRIDKADIISAIENGRCTSLKAFCNDLLDSAGVDNRFS